jgi:hypothetical protein
MTTMKTCSNGHNYDSAKYQECPYCPGFTTDEDYDKTLSDFKKTQLLKDEQNKQFDKTMLNEETMALKKTSESSGNEKNPLKHTSIIDEGVTMSGNLPKSEKRKIVGWLVTFSHDEYGQDYKLYVGKNKIGSATGCDIIINDTSVSGDHATILFRENEFLIKDNFSTNGTKINGVSSDEGKLKDGDEIKLGNTIFKLKTVF